METPAPITARELIERYDGIVLDALGVLVDAGGALPGAPAFVDELNRRGTPYCVLTNSAAQTAESKAASFRAKGLAIGRERILASGMLIEPYFAEHGLAGARTVVLGPDDASRFVEAAGGVPVDPETAEDAEVVVVADQKGFDLLAGLDNTLGLILRRLDAGRPLHLLLCNPDLIYPAGAGRYGFTAGSIARMFDAVLAERYPGQELGFTPLGKPHRPFFAEAARRLGSDNIVMVGDQLVTDIRGANEYGIDSALVATGLIRGELPDVPWRPTWRIADLNPN